MSVYETKGIGRAISSIFWAVVGVSVVIGAAVTFMIFKAFGG